MKMDGRRDSKKGCVLNGNALLNRELRLENYRVAGHHWNWERYDDVARVENPLARRDLHTRATPVNRHHNVI